MFPFLAFFFCTFGSMDGYRRSAMACASGSGFNLQQESTSLHLKEAIKMQWMMLNVRRASFVGIRWMWLVKRTVADVVLAEICCKVAGQEADWRSLDSIDKHTTSVCHRSVVFCG